MIKELTTIVGSEYVHQEPHLSVAPATSEELAQVVALAHAEKVAVVPYGGGTKQSWGLGNSALNAQNASLVIHTTRLNRVLDYNPDDLTISVEAGMTMATLRETLAANGQMLPIDAPLPERATVGGMLATAMDCPRRLGYGTARDMLIGIQVVESTGRMSKAGGMVVKNVSGFDMMKLYLGSMGSLAIIVSANFKLYPQPRTAASIRCTFQTPDAAFALANAIAESPLTPVAVEYLHGVALTEGAPTLLVAAEGLPAAVERHVRDVSAMAERHGTFGVVVFREGDHESQWNTISAVTQTAQVDDDTLVARLTCLPAELTHAITQVRSLAADGSLALKISARALSGVAYLRLSGSNEALRTWHKSLLRDWPNLAVLAAPAALAGELPAWGALPANLELIRNIKREFDPDGLLNPGRYIV
jgi:glycolate oxidase FAD binding subunit